MPEISLAKNAPLRPFKIDVRNKRLITFLFNKLEIRMFGWNLPELFEKHCMAIDPSLLVGYHYREMLRLVEILVGGNNEALIDDPSARFDESHLDGKLFAQFVSSFVDELQKIVCESGNRTICLPPNSKAYMQWLHGAMTSAVYSKMNFQSPAIPAITALLLILLANLHVLSFCKKSTSDIVESLMRV
jgi:hypothetical protein